jgi:type VI secretion system protein ImpH
VDADGRARFDALIREVSRDPGHHGFFVVLRELERLAGDGFHWGESKHPEEDPVRVTQNLSLAFEGREIAAVHSGASGQPPRLLQNIITLLGPSGPMPLHFAEMVRDRELNSGDPVLARFLDLILHRVFTLYYRAWALNRVEISADREIEEDGLLRAILSMIGLGPAVMDSQAPIDPRSIAAQLGPLSRPTRGVRQLERQLGVYFSIPVRVEPFQPCISRISKVGRWRLQRYPKDSTMRLGAGLPIGKTTISLSDRFRVVIGPLDRKDYARFLPGERSRARLEEWVRLFVGTGLDWDVQLLMKSESAGRWCLGRTGGGRIGGRLRRDVWLGGKRPETAATGYHRRFEQVTPSSTDHDS